MVVLLNTNCSMKLLITFIAFTFVLTSIVSEGRRIEESYFLTDHIKPDLKGAVVSNGPGCAEIGRGIMKRGGNVIDTVIATAFCEGVVNPSTMGLGGGFIATIFNKTTGEVYNFNARESAPAAAREDMFVKNQTLSGIGGLSVAIPSELRGYWYLYKNFGGKLPWRELVEPTIKMCLNGIAMNSLTERNVKTLISTVRADPGLKAIFINPKTNDVYKIGELYKRPKLAATLSIIAREGGDALNKGSLTKDFVKDIQDNGGIITANDLRNYKPEILKPVHTNIANKDIYSFPLPASGPLLIYILNILEKYVNPDDPFSITNVQRLAESFKFAYGKRSILGDRNFVQGLDAEIEKLVSKYFARETRAKINDYATSNDPSYYGAHSESKVDHGTANICVWAPNGDGISLTSSVNFILGAGFASKSTDIILNNSMDDFSSPGITNVYGIPPSPSNFIRPGKRPLSSMAPSVILDHNRNLYMIVGGAGGSKITTSVAQVVINRLYYNMDVRSASDARRIHHQLLPMTLVLEDEWLREGEDVVLKLQQYGHNVNFSTPDGFNAVTAISVDDFNKHELVGVHDKRRIGSVGYLR